MILDAVAAEAFKLRRNVGAWFWGFAFVPILALAASLIGDVFLRPSMGEGPLAEALTPPVNLAQVALNGLGNAASPLTILFALIAAAILFAGEYRWETWRLMLPRNDRVSHLMGKVIVFAAGSAVTVVLIGLMALVSSLVGAAVTGAEITFDGPASEGFAGKLLGLGGLAWLMLMQAGAVAALAAVATRSMLGAIFVPIGLGIGQGILQAQAMMDDPLAPEWWRLLALPSLAGEYVRAWLYGQAPVPGVEIPGSLALIGTACLLAWLVAGFGGAVGLFLRQDLSKE